MLNRLGRGLIFVVGSVVGGLALAFLIVAARPDLIRGESAASGAAALPAAPASVAGPALPGLPRRCCRGSDPGGRPR